ncbi:MAG: SRPBCC family protein, partial [Sciscionella sp.]
AGAVPWNEYRFHGEWSVPVPVATAFEVLADLGEYPTWWREVRSISKVDEDCAELVCRSRLPYDLVFRASHDRKDEAAGVLRARLTGDLDGYCGWVITAGEATTTLTWEQHVVVTKPLLRALAPIARPVLKANHELMMRSGRRGLRAYLSRDLQ